MSLYQLIVGDPDQRRDALYLLYFCWNNHLSSGIDSDETTTQWYKFLRMHACNKWERTEGWTLGMQHDMQACKSILCGSRSGGIKQ